MTTQEREPRVHPATRQQIALTDIEAMRDLAMFVLEELTTDDAIEAIRWWARRERETDEERVEALEELVEFLNAEGP